MEWSNKLKNHHIRIKKISLDEFTDSPRIKIPKDEESDLMNLEEKIKEKYFSYEENAKDIKMVDIASKVVIPGGLSITTVTASIVGSPALAVGGAVFSIGLGVYFALRKGQMKLKSP